MDVHGLGECFHVWISLESFLGSNYSTHCIGIYTGLIIPRNSGIKRRAFSPDSLSRLFLSFSLLGFACHSKGITHDPFPRRGACGIKDQARI